MLSQFFIRRPIFAISIALVVVLVGALSYASLPREQYPNISPPTVTVSTTYVGANAEVVAQNVAVPIEEAINGVPNMLYMQSTSSAAGGYSLTATFALGTDPDLDAVAIQNRVSQAAGNLPAAVNNFGVTVRKASPNFLMAFAVYSPNDSYDPIFLSNYVLLHVLDPLLRVPGVGDSLVFPEQNYAIRAWLRPDALAALGLTAADVTTAIQSQNVVAPAGSLGEPPVPNRNASFQYTVNAAGQLTTPDEYARMVVKTLPDGSVVRLQDVARTELGAQDYSTYGLRNHHPAAIILLLQSPGSNALNASHGLHQVMADVAKTFPPGLTYDVAFDSTTFITAALNDVTRTLVLSFCLVLLVVFIFLGNARASLIPMAAVPVALIGTFGAFTAMGFTINILTMFAMVLAIGLVVDDAIVVVEAVERQIEGGLAPMAAADAAMKMVSSPVIAIALVLDAVFIPSAFIGGISGQLYRQFALTLAVAVTLSAFVALTLTPALCAALLRPHGEPRNPLDRLLAAFNRMFTRITETYVRLVRVAIRLRWVVLASMILVAWMTFQLLHMLPSTFVPLEDQGFFVASFRLPDGASQARAEALATQAITQLLKIPGVDAVTTVGGYDLLSQSINSNTLAMFVTLKPWDERRSPQTQLFPILLRANAVVASYPQAIAFAFPLPPIPGVGAVNGFQFITEDLNGTGQADALARVAQSMVAAASKQPAITSVSTSFRTTVPQYNVDINRDKAATLGVSVDSILENLGAFLGGIQVNNVTLFGRVYKTMIQAEPAFRTVPSDIGDLYVRSTAGAMIPLNTLVTVAPGTGPNLVSRYNGYYAAEIDGQAPFGQSSAKAITAMEGVAKTTLPAGYGYEWTGLARQEQEAGGSQALAFVLALVLVFLLLAALYESWSIPLSVLLGVPLAAFGSLFAILLRGILLRDVLSDVYVQIGLVMLVGLAAKNAILIVEFAKAKHDDEGMSFIDAAIAGARLRYRPIVMTSMTFIVAAMSLVIATGPGANSRHSLGTSVVGGMTVATAFGVFVIPALYVLMAGRDRRAAKRPPLPAAPAAEPAAEDTTPRQP